MSDLSGRLRAFNSDAGRCTRCHDEHLLYVEDQRRAYPVFQKDPTGTARMLVVAEAPNMDDCFNDQKRRLTYDDTTDPTGRFATQLLASVGLRPDDVLFTNAVLCLPARKNGKHPVTARQIELCSPWLAKLIEVADPLVVVTLGAHALKALDRLERHRLTLKQGVGKLHTWRGRQLLPLYHPGLLGRVTRPEAQQMQDIAVLKSLVAQQPRLNLGLIKEIMSATVDGARLVLRSGQDEAEDTAFVVGFQWSEPARFAYLSPSAGLPFRGDTRFYVESLKRLAADAWLVECRHESGVKQIEIHSLGSAQDADAIRTWINRQPHDVIEHAEETMRSMLDPKTL